LTPQGVRATRAPRSRADVLMPFGHKEGGKQLKVFARLGAVGLELGISTVIGLVAGRWVDEELGSEPTAAVIGLLLGVAAGFRSLFRTARNAMKELAQHDGAGDNGAPTDPEDNPKHGHG